VSAAPAALLALLLAAAPVLECPPGTELAGGAPPEGYEAWCEGVPDDAGRLRRHGPSRAWWDGGAVRQEARWSRGRRDGELVEYHRNGRRAQAGRYLDDEKEGPWSTWSEGGQLTERAEYRRGVRHGLFAAWWPGGRRKAEGRFCQGMQCGAWSSWDEAGRELGKMVFDEPLGPAPPR
jgi:hypothetical protein